MAVKVIRNSNTTNFEVDAQFVDTDFGQRETTVDGYTFHWGLNQTRNFADDGVGIAHAAFGAVNVVQDIIPFGDSLS